MSFKDLFNRAKRRAKEEAEDRDARCEPIAEQIMAIICEGKPTAKTGGDIIALKKQYEPMATKINILMRDSGLTIDEANYTWSIVQSMFDMTKQMSSEAIQLALELLEQKIFDVDNMLDVPLQQLDDMLKLHGKATTE